MSSRVPGRSCYHRRRLWSPLLAGLIIALFWLPTVAAADTPVAEPNAFATADVNLRAGPDTDFPILVLIPAQAAVTIYDCIPDLTWCDVSYGEERGWVSAQFIQALYQDRNLTVQEYVPQVGLPTAAFDIRTYWNSYYQDQPFFAQLDLWATPSGQPAVRTSSFYQPLANYGDWAEVGDQYVWVPHDVDHDWRPYTRGHWAYTDDGWFWASNEPFGWATYHYGRWGYSADVGWFWVPGTTWAPAWVAWRGSDDYLAWAPLPPAPDASVSISINVGTVPDYYWQCVPAQSFLSINLSADIIRDHGRFDSVFGETRPLGNTTIINNTIVNKVVNVTYVEQKTRQKVVVQRLEKVGRPTANAGIGKVAMVAPPPAPGGRPPPHARRLEDVAAISKTKGQAPNKSTVDLAKLRNGNPPTLAGLKGPGQGGPACTGGRVRIGNQCQCPPGASANGRGVCVPAQRAALSQAPGKPGALGAPGGPKCVGGRVAVGNQCQCPPGAAAKANGPCVPTQQAAATPALGKPGAPKCTGGHVALGGQCQCPPRTADNGHGVCVLSQQATAAPVPGKPGGPKCTGGETLIGNQCQCPAGTTRDNRGICVPGQQAGALKGQDQAAALKAQQEAAARQKALQDQAAAQKAQQEAAARQKALQDQAAAQKAQQEAAARLRAQQEQAAAQKAQQDQASAQKAQQEALAKQKADQQAAAQKAQQEALAKQKADQQAAAQKAQQEALARQKALQQQAAAQKAGQEALAKQKALEQQAAAKAQQEAVARQKALQQQAAAQKAQQEALARQKAVEQQAAAQKAQQEAMARQKALQQQQAAAQQRAQQEAALARQKALQQQQAAAAAAAQRAQQQAAAAAAQRAQQQAAAAAAQKAQQEAAGRAAQCPPGMIRTAQGVCRSRG